jgi:hypothetical protein
MSRTAYLRLIASILRRNSQKVKKTIRESTENKTRDIVIEITEYSYDVYYAFLTHLYTDCIDIRAEKVINLSILANDYKEELKVKCFDIIKNNITLENICSLYCSSIKYNCLNFASISPHQKLNKS